MPVQRQVVHERTNCFRSGTRACVHPRRWVLHLLLGVAVVLIAASTSSLRSDQNPPPAKVAEASPSPTVNAQSPRQNPKAESELKKSNREKTQEDAAALAVLADQLRDEINNLNVNVFSLDVIQKTEDVERLARKIKEEAGKGQD